MTESEPTKADVEADSSATDESEAAAIDLKPSAAPEKAPAPALKLETESSAVSVGETKPTVVPAVPIKVEKKGHVLESLPKIEMKPPVVASAPPAAVRRPIPAQAAPLRTTKSKKKKGHSHSLGGSSGPGGHGENTGRWTAEEHRLFLQGLEQHGKGWKKIASLIKSRTVVQIRTHAQKYFQKLAKARQNGEEGDVTMEGRGGISSAASVATSAAAQNTKRRRQTSGTKRKAIQSVVSSSIRQGKKMATETGATTPPLPAVAPVLAHFVLPNSLAPPSIAAKSSFAQGNSQGSISGPALEDSIFRFLTPAPVSAMEPPLNDIARQAGANPITVPSDHPSTAPTGGEISPTGVTDLSIYPSWTDAKDPPSWYAKGADVDALLDVGDSLDWLADTGDLHETYQPPSLDSAPSLPDMDIIPNKVETGLKRNMASTSVNDLVSVDPNAETVVPPLPSIFDGTPNSSEHALDKKGVVASASAVQLAAEAAELGDSLFDTPMEEQDFVSTILENSESAADLSGLA